MFSQALVDEHAREVRATASSFGRQVERAANGVVVGLLQLVGGLPVDEGVLVQSQENSAALLGLERNFFVELNKTDYYPSVVAFVSSFVDQVQFFRDLHGGAFAGYIGEEDSEVLAAQGAIAVEVMVNYARKVGMELHQLVARSLGGVPVSSVTKEVTTAVTKLTRVEQMGHDHCYIWFRMFGDLAYARAGLGQSKFLYVGPSFSGRSRPFCDELVGTIHTRGEIDAMDNGQLPGVFHNGGGHGCEHYWVPKV